MFVVILYRFDLSNSNVNNFDLDKISPDKRPDVILVKKQFSEKSFRNRQRRWRLHRLEREAAMSANSNERFVHVDLAVFVCNWC